MFFYWTFLFIFLSTSILWAIYTYTYNIVINEQILIDLDIHSLIKSLKRFWLNSNKPNDFIIITYTNMCMNKKNENNNGNNGMYIYEMIIHVYIYSLLFHKLQFNPLTLALSGPFSHIPSSKKKVLNSIIEVFFLFEFHEKKNRKKDRYKSR